MSSKQKLEHDLAQALQEVKALKRKMEDKDHDLEASKHKINKQEHLLQKLKDKIECPVCLDVPRTGPMPVCPNGHIVCQKCKRDSCPTCRTGMGAGKSLLAVTILETIEHRCMFDLCEEKFAVEDLEKHEALCLHRTVNCPHSECTESISLSELFDHLKKSEKCSINNRSPVPHSAWDRRNYNITSNMSLKNMNWKLRIYHCFGELFAIMPLKSEGNFYFVIVMFASETECSKYKIEMIVHGRETEALESELTAKFQGSPLSIDVKKEDLNFYSSSERFMAKMLNNSINKTSFSLSFHIYKNE